MRWHPPGACWLAPPLAGVITAVAGPAVVIVYDQFLINVRRARFAIEADNVTQRVDALGKARDAIME